MKRYKRIYKVSSANETLYSTRLRDVFRMLSRILLSDREYGFYRLTFEVISDE